MCCEYDQRTAGRLEEPFFFVKTLHRLLHKKIETAPVWITGAVFLVRPYGTIESGLLVPVAAGFDVLLTLIL